jgi:hypothetical protein
VFIARLALSNNNYIKIIQIRVIDSVLSKYKILMNVLCICLLRVFHSLGGMKSKCYHALSVYYDLYMLICMHKYFYRVAAN